MSRDEASGECIAILTTCDRNPLTNSEMVLNGSIFSGDAPTLYLLMLLGGSGGTRGTGCFRVYFIICVKSIWLKRLKPDSSK